MAAAGGRASTVASNRNSVAASAMGMERRRGGGRLIGSRGNDCTKGVVSGRWAAAGEGVGFGRGWRGGNINDVRDER